MAVTIDKPQVKRRYDPAESAIHIIRGLDAILRMHGMLIELSARCDQDGAMDHLEYFLKRPRFSNKNPGLILFCSGANPPTTSDEIEGAVLLYEYQMAGFGCGIFVADYYGGDRTVIAARPFRAQIASLACAALLAQGALAVQLTYQADLSGFDGERFVGPFKVSSRWRRASSMRQMHGCVLLEDSYDATLSNFGKHTRRNLRASRRYAEADFGYTFIADPVMTKEEFLALNRLSTYPVSDELATWRYEATKLVQEPLFLSIRGSDGEWLSAIGGRRQRNGTFVEWQMNRAGMTKHSLGTLMRSHLIEYELQKGSRRLYFVGGTTDSMKYSIGSEYFVDLVAWRRALLAFLLNRFARPLMLEKTFLVQTLADPKLNWQPW
jgi:hypothetical protein